MSLGTDLLSALEVTPNPGADPKEAASASNDQEPEGDAASDDRKALNVAKRAERMVEKLDQQIGELTNTVVGALGNREPAARPEPVKPPSEPYGREDVQTAVSSGDMASALEMVMANLDHRIEEAQKKTVSTVDQRAQARDARMYLVKKLGLTDVNRAENKLISDEATRLQNEYPDVFGRDRAAAEGMASGIVYRQIAMGQLEVPDMRAESLDRDKEPAGKTAAGPVETETPTTITPNWKAANRGLPPDMVEGLKSWAPEVLEQSDDPTEERARREAIIGLIGGGNHGDW